MSEDRLFASVTRPSECAVLVAVPLSREQFEQDVAAAQTEIPAEHSRGDYAVRMARKDHYGGDLAKAWDEDGAVVANLCLKVIEDARSVGAHTYASATPETLSDAIRSGAHVIILIAHWKGSRILATDIRIPPFKEFVGGPRPSHRLQRTVWDTLNRGIREDGGRLRSSVIADQLNRLMCREAGYEIDDGDWLDFDEFMDGPEDRANIGAARDQFDDEFAGIVVPGNCLELRDGYRKGKAVAGMFPDHWGGLVELCVCTSMSLAFAIKQGRDDRRIITNERAKDPERCLPELRETLLRLASGTHEYAALRGKVFAEYTGILSGTGRP